MADEALHVSNSAPPFLTKTYEMVQDPSTDPVVSWSQNGKTFIVWNPTEFSRLLLPIFFRHNNFSSFIRQLNTYGFRKVHPEQWEFANECFVRGRPDLIRNIYRRKPVYSHSGPNLITLPRLTKFEKKGYKDDIKKLKYDKESLAAEMERVKEEERGLGVKIRTLTESVKNVETQHINILSSLAHTLRSIGGMSQMDEGHSRKRRFIGGSSCLFEETFLSRIPNPTGNLDNDALLILNRELLERLESSLIFWEKIVFDVPDDGPNSSSLELVESGSHCPTSPSISYTQLDVDIGVRFSVIDMNSEPRSGGVLEVNLQQTHANEKEKSVGTAADRRTGINDVFWERLLTENPRLNADSAVNKKNETKWMIQGNIGGI